MLIVGKETKYTSDENYTYYVYGTITVIDKCREKEQWFFLPLFNITHTNINVTTPVMGLTVIYSNHRKQKPLTLGHLFSEVIVLLMLLSPSLGC